MWGAQQPLLCSTPRMHPQPQPAPADTSRDGSTGGSHAAPVCCPASRSHPWKQFKSSKSPDSSSPRDSLQSSGSRPLVAALGPHRHAACTQQGNGTQSIRGGHGALALRAAALKGGHSCTTHGRQLQCRVLHLQHCPPHADVSVGACAKLGGGAHSQLPAVPARRLHVEAPLVAHIHLQGVWAQRSCISRKGQVH